MHLMTELPLRMNTWGAGRTRAMTWSLVHRDWYGVGNQAVDDHHQRARTSPRRIAGILHQRPSCSWRNRGWNIELQGRKNRPIVGAAKAPISARVVGDHDQREIARHLSIVPV
jgi:hypothetical protein